MADDVPITPGSGANIAADDIGSVFYQRNKLIHGVNGTNDGDVAKTNPLPVQLGQALTRGMQLTQLTALSSSGNNNVVSTDGSKTIKVYGWCWKVAGAVNVKWRDNANTTDLCPALPFTANGDGMIVDPMGAPYFITAAGGNLQLNLSAAVAVSGWVLWSQE